ncbi:MAG: hypothetical protein VX913_08525 [Planctomycetota bacterium]|nr:hypothetical protein [Planctomycetota bacterium]
MEICKWLLCLLVVAPSASSQDPVALASRRELFVDRALIDRLDGAELRLGRPRDEGEVLRFDKPWEGPFCGYATVLKDGDLYRLYYRGLPKAGGDNSPLEVTCVAESADGIQWTRPDVGRFDIGGSKRNNVVLANAAPVTHNFSPFVDARPGVPAEERFKALGGSEASGLLALASADGLAWRRLQDKPAITAGQFDSQNVAFWSASEARYVCYFRTWSGGGWSGFRTISRATSDDFKTWTKPARMTFGDTPPEHLYTNQTHPYFRAPHLYVSIAARFFPGRRVLSPEQARAIGVNPKYFGDCSDGVLMTSRGGTRYDRTFMEAFVRPGIGPNNWVSRTNYPALGVVQTGDEEMSFYVQHDYAQPTAHLRRYALRLDGFAAVSAPYAGGEMVTRPLTFTGTTLDLNFATSAAGEIRLEIQDAKGRPLPGFRLSETPPIIGNEVSRSVVFGEGARLETLRGRPIRLRFVLKDAQLFSLRFR